MSPNNNNMNVPLHHIERVEYGVDHPYYLIRIDDAGICKAFYDHIHLTKQNALDNAKKFLDGVYAEHPEYRNMKNRSVVGKRNNTGYEGVNITINRHTGHLSVKAIIGKGGKSKSFGIKKYGYEEALYLAYKARKVSEGFSPKEILMDSVDFRRGREYLKSQGFTV